MPSTNGPECRLNGSHAFSNKKHGFWRKIHRFFTFGKMRDASNIVRLFKKYERIDHKRIILEAMIAPLEKSSKVCYNKQILNSPYGS